MDGVLPLGVVMTSSLPGTPPCIVAVTEVTGGDVFCAPLVSGVWSPFVEAPPNTTLSPPARACSSIKFFDNAIVHCHSVVQRVGTIPTPSCS